MAKHLRFVFLSGVLLLPLFLSLACPGAVYPDNGTPPEALNAEGNREPLATHKAAKIVRSGDPMWCPVVGGVPTLPGGAGCSPNFGTSQALIDNMDVTDPQTPGFGLYEQPGIIYFTADLTNPGNSFILIRGGLDDNVASPELYGADYDALKGYDLILQGGWSGVNGDTNFTQSNFGANPVQIGTFTDPWVGSVTINNITIDGASTRGLTVYTNGDINIANVTSNNNTLNGAYLDNCLDTGAGCTGSGSVNISSSTFSDNGGSGLEARSNGNITITGMTASNNTGSGIFNSGTLTVTNSTISGNSATNGGGIYNESGTVTVMNSTISGNSATNGGGLYNLSGTVTVTNSIIAASTGGNCGGAITDGGNNIDDGATCGFGALMSNVNPLLDPAGLQNNGGPTRTIALLPGSPAINAAAGCPATDQRGIARPQCGACDIGAYEFVFISTTTTVSSSSSPSIFGSGVTFTATLTGGATGTVTFVDGATTLCAAAPIVGTTATCSTSALSLGSHAIAATYSGDNTRCGSTGTVAQTVNQAATTTAITSDNPDPSAVGQAVTVSYVISVVSPGSGSPTGNVTVSDGVNSCTGTVAGGTCSIVLTTAGARTITATYAGDGNFNGSSGTASHVVLTQNLLSITKAGTGTGTVTADVIGIEGNGINCGPDCAETYNEGTVVTLTAAPANGSAFGGWSGDSDCADGQVAVNAAMTCTAAFDLVTTVTIPAATGNGMITLTTGSPGCGFYNISAKTEAQVGSSDPSYDYPYGLVEFWLSCPTADVTITFPGSIINTTYRKYGPTTPGDPSTTQWYTFGNVTPISSTSVTAHFTNGQLGDDTGVEDQVIVDQGGPGQPISGAVAVPTMDQWGLMILIALLGIGSVYYLLRRRVENRDTSHFA